MRAQFSPRTTAIDSSVTAPASIGLPINAAELSEADLNARLDDARSAGVTSVQSGAAWWYMCPTRTVCDFSSLDRLVAAARVRAMEVSLQITGTPDWVHPDLSPLPESTRRWAMPRTAGERSAFAAFATTLAGRYSGQVRRYEIWNEPNLPEFSYPDVSPERFAQLMATGYKAIKNSDPTALVVSGGLSRGDVGFGSAFLTRLDAIRGASANSGYLDELGVHPYSDNLSPLANLQSKIYTGPLGRVNSNFTGISSLLQLLDTRGRSATRLWLGEYGFSTKTTWMTAVPDEQRAIFMLMAADAVQRQPRIAGLVWYAFLPNSATESWWSIMERDGEPTLTFKALAVANANLASGRTSTRADVGALCRLNSTLTGTVSVSAGCLGLPVGNAQRYEVYVDGVVAQQGLGGYAEFDSRAVSNGAHRVAVAFYGSGTPTYSGEVESVVSNASVSPPCVADLSVSRNGDGSYLGSAVIQATPAIDVAQIAIAVRSASGGNYDFVGLHSGATITPTGLRLNSSKSFPPGTYVAWVAYYVDTAWHNLTTKVTFTVP